MDVRLSVHHNLVNLVFKGGTLSEPKKVFSRQMLHPKYTQECMCLCLSACGPVRHPIHLQPHSRLYFALPHFYHFYKILKSFWNILIENPYRKSL